MHPGLTIFLFLGECDRTGCTNEWDAVMDLYVAQRNTLLRDQDHNFKVRQKFTKGHT